ERRKIDDRAGRRGLRREDIEKLTRAHDRMSPISNTGYVSQDLCSRIGRSFKDCEDRPFSNSHIPVRHCLQPRTALSIVPMRDPEHAAPPEGGFDASLVGV